MYNLKRNQKTLVTVFLSLAFLCIAQCRLLAATYTNYPVDVVCTPNGDMKTSIGFAWYTNTEAKGSVVQLKIKGDTSEFGVDPNLSFTGTCETVSTYNVHKVVATGLKPGTKYEYRVGDLEKGYWSTDPSSLNSVGCFETAPDNEEAFTFINLGDINGGSVSGMEAFGKSIQRAANLFPSYKFIVQNGDTVDNTTDKDVKENQWEFLFRNSQSYLSNTIWAGAIGNHDASPDDTNYNQHFNYKPAGNNGTYYSFDYSNAHFLVLDTNNNIQEQVEWAKYDVVKNNKKWNIAVFHRPLYTNGTHYNEVTTRNLWSAPLCDILGIDIGFTGHDHVYNRNYYLLNGQPIPDSVNVSDLNNIVTNPVGSLFILNNCCAKKFYQPDKTRNSEYIKISEQPNCSTYAGVTVANDLLTCNVYYNDNNTDVLLDTFGIKKTKLKPKAPSNVKIAYNIVSKSATITWEDWNNEDVRDYVIYDENNKYKLNWTHFMNGTDVKSYTINNLTEENFNECSFAVKAVGDKSFSDAAISTVREEVINVKELKNFDELTGKILVKGQISSKYYGENISLLLYKKNEIISKQSVGYVDESIISEDGSYIFKFPFHGNIDDYELKMYMGNNTVTDTITKAVADYSWLDASVQIDRLDATSLSSQFAINNHYDVEGLTYTICLAFYSSDNKLLGITTKKDVNIGLGVTSDDLCADIPSGAVRGTAMIWSNYTQMIPLGKDNAIIE